MQCSNCQFRLGLLSAVMNLSVLCSKGLSCMWRNAYCHLCLCSLDVSSPSHSQWKQSPEEPWELMRFRVRGAPIELRPDRAAPSVFHSIFLSVSVTRELPSPSESRNWQLMILSTPLKKKTKERHGQKLTPLKHVVFENFTEHLELAHIFCSETRLTLSSVTHY